MNNYTRFDRIIMSFLSPLSPQLASKYIYWQAFRHKLDLNNPKTFDEKLMWLKLNVYTDNELITQCADKWKVRNYISACGCSELLIPLIGVWSSPEDIPFDSLPDSFALKCNHGCGYNIICRDKKALDIPNTKRTLNKWMREKFWTRFAETNYREIIPRIIAEEYLGSDDHPTPLDYKFYCFHGKALYVMVCCERDKGRPKFYFFNRDWELERINQDGLAAPEGFTLPRPHFLEQMFSYADRLSAPFPFVRVDLYESGEQIKFGELTFTPAAALDTARLPQADHLFFDLLKLPQLRSIHEQR